MEPTTCGPQRVQMNLEYETFGILYERASNCTYKKIEEETKIVMHEMWATRK